MVNGSSKPNGCTATALQEIAKVLREEGIDSEIVCLGGGPLRDCIGCLGCTKLDGQCAFNDDCINEILEKAKTCDGFIFGTPVYYAHPSGRILSFLDRAFYSGSGAFRFKPGAAVAVARRGGTTASFDCLNKYFGISQMPVIGSTYWNNVHGAAPGEAAFDAEGLQTMRNLARNLAWMLKCFEAGKKSGIPLPETEKGNRTNFIR